jgi:hypothetical protein
MTYKAKVAVCSEIRKKHLTRRSEHRVEFLNVKPGGRVQLKCDVTRRRTRGEMKGKQDNGVGNQ